MAETIDVPEGQRMSQPFGPWGYHRLISNPHIPPRRLALLRVAPECVVGLLQGLGQRRITVAGLPDDAQVFGAMYDETCRCFVVTLESEAFAEVPHGAVLPYIDPTLTDHGPLLGEHPGEIGTTLGW